MSTTMSRLSCSSCETPFSTLKWWLSVPLYQVRSSETERKLHIMRMIRVHWPPRREGEVYDGFVLADLRKSVRVLQDVNYPVAEEARHTESIKRPESSLLGLLPKRILVELVGCEPIHGRYRREISYKIQTWIRQRQKE